MSTPEHWRYASTTPTLIGIDLKAYIPFVASLFTQKSDLILGSLVILGIFGVLGKLGIGVDVAIRKIRHYVRGKILPSKDFIYWKVFNRR